MLECWRRGVYRSTGINHWIAWPGLTNNGLGGRRAVGGEACKRRGSAHNARRCGCDAWPGRQAGKAEVEAGRQAEAEAEADVDALALDVVDVAALA